MLRNFSIKGSELNTFEKLTINLKRINIIIYAFFLSKVFSSVENIVKTRFSNSVNFFFL